MIGQDHIGHRVVVRRLVAVDDHRPIFTDVLGVLLTCDETEITVRTRAGDVRVPVSHIVATKPVPDRRKLSKTEALELAAMAGWPAAEVERLGDWWLRATAGWTMRGNSVLPIGDPGLPIDEAIDAVVAWYRRRGLPPAISVPLPLRARLDAELDRRGWADTLTSLVMTVPLAELRPPRRAEEVRLDPTPSPEWLAVAAGRKGSLPAEALTVLTGVPEVRFAMVYGQAPVPLATARGVVADPERRWLGLSLIETAASARRQGFAQHVVGALADWARDLGATDAYLQVAQPNTAAVALYERLGFRIHHSYVARVLA